MPENRGRYTMIILGGVTVAIVAAAFTIAALQPDGDVGAAPTPTGVPAPTSVAPSPRPTLSPTATPELPPQAELTQEGWLVKPVTTDPERFGVAMIEATTTFDPNKSEHYEWVTYLRDWLIVGPRDRDIRNDSEQAALLMGRGGELYDVLPSDDFWADLASKEGFLTASVSDVSVTPAPEVFVNEWDITGTVTFNYTMNNGGTIQSWSESAGELQVRVACESDAAGNALPCEATRWYSPTE